MSFNNIEAPSLSICESCEKQTTLGRDFTFEGIGIFSGKDVSFTAVPSDKNSGIVFAYNDFLIPAKIDFVEDVPNRTKLVKDGKSIQVVEHLLSALYGLGIDNVLIEVNSDELPIMDASAHDYVEAILDAGIVEQNEHAVELVVEKPIGIAEGNTSIWLMPDTNPRITYFLEHEHPQIGGMSDSMRINRNNFRDFIGCARTFVTNEEAKLLIENHIVGTDNQNIEGERMERNRDP